MKTIIKNVFHPQKGHSDVLIENERIADIKPSNTMPSVEGSKEIDATGYVMLPPFVDAHCHIDKTVYGMDWFVNNVGPRRIDRITDERNNRDKFGIDPFLQSSRHIELSLSKGTLHMRSNVDIDTANKLKGVEGILKAREIYKDDLDLEIVAFPQSGLISRPGTLELVDQALTMGVDIIGGIDPGLVDRDPKGSIDAIFKLAEKHNKPIDIHLHEYGDLGTLSMELITERTIADGMQGRVTISHAFCLGMPNKKAVEGLLEGLAKAEIQITTCAQAELTEYPFVKELLNADINVAAGNDDMRDMWSPFGSADMAERAMLIAMKQDYVRDEDLELAMRICTYNGAKLLEIEDYGIDMGCIANCVLMRSRNVAECVVTHNNDRIVIRKGAVIAEDGHYHQSKI